MNGKRRIGSWKYYDMTILIKNALCNLYIYIDYKFLFFLVGVLNIFGCVWQIPANGGMLAAIYAFHSRDVARSVLGLMSFFVIVNALSSFQIYGMPMFDDMESQYTQRFKKPCPWWLRAIIRAMFGYGVFFVAVAIPFLSSMAGLIGAISLPVTLAHPCFMWLKFKKPKKYGPLWWLNWTLGLSGMGLSAVLSAAGVSVIIDTRIKLSFFKPQ